jgi:hypothetical protein
MSESENQSADEPPIPDPQPLVPATSPAEDHKSRSGEERGEELRFSSKHEILFKLDQLSGLVAIGVVPPAKANSMRSIYHTMLSNLGDSSPVGAAAVADDDVVKIMQLGPELLKVIQPLLTPDQLNLIIREASKNE